MLGIAKKKSPVLGRSKLRSMLKIKQTQTSRTLTSCPVKPTVSPCDSVVSLIFSDMWDTFSLSPKPRLERLAAFILIQPIHWDVSPVMTWPTPWSLSLDSHLQTNPCVRPGIALGSCRKWWTGRTWFQLSSSSVYRGVRQSEDKAWPMLRWGRAEGAQGTR